MATTEHAAKNMGGRIHVLAEHFHALLKCAPDLANSIPITAAGSAWTYGAATDMINGTSGTTVNDDYDVHYILINGASANTEYQVGLFDGATQLGCVVFEKTATVDPEFSLPISMPIVVGGTTLTAKLATKAGGGETVRIKLKYHTY